MALIYITGIAGSGKSTVQKALSQRGYSAHDVDKPGIGAAYDNRTGAIVKMPPSEERTPEWFESHSWKTSSEAIKKLKEQAEHRLVFLCGVASNESEMWPLFDMVLCLDIDEATLRQRIATREDNDFGKSEHELQLILGWHKTVRQKYEGLGATIIDGAQSVEDIVDQVLQAAV